TFFFRQMRELIERGYLYIAQPPLYKVVEKKKELYIQNEDQMKSYVIENGVEKVNLMSGDGSPFPVTGAKLLQLIKKVMRTEDLLDRFERDRRDRNLIRIVAGDPGLNEEAFENDHELLKIAGRTVVALGADVITDYRIDSDPDHGGFKLVFEIKHGNKTLTNCIDKEMFRTPQFSEIRNLVGQTNILGEAPYRDQPADAGAPIELPTARALVDHIISLGKKGLTIQRYKGLGEMNPEQLWETTMNPEKRTLLRVSVEDAVVADEIFTTLMGDQVEPRRDFIYQNALYVSNLDI
ncbi:MAG TPA: DNA gyrase subunit B, partial [Smithellaceae bacterium]|nr:DNA gyrase subunit B [Smithellaceae bacterium]